MRNWLVSILISIAVLMTCRQFVYADTITLKDGRKIEGSVIEELKDSYVVKIPIGTIRLDKKDIVEIKRISPEENYLNFGNQYLATENYDAALEQYRKALEINPEFQPAKDAIVQVEKLKKEIEEKRRAELERKRKEFLKKKERITSGFGFELEAADSGIRIFNVIKNSGADVAGLRKDDRIVQIDAKPIKGKSLENIIDYLLEEERQLYSFIIQREVNLVRKQIEYLRRSFVGVGIFLDVVEGDLIISNTIRGEPADLAGVKSKDRIISIDGKPTVKISLDEAAELIGGLERSNLKLVIQREVKLERK